jgi:hypothetical protein
MGKYRKKPIVIEASQWQGPDHFYPEWLSKVLEQDHRDRWGIETLEGFMLISDGDWLIQGIKGEVYPCKNDIFLESYEAAE